MRLRQDSLMWRRAEDEVIALDLAGSEYLGTNATGTIVWEALAAGTSRDALVELLCERFAVTPEVVGPDIDRLLADLSQRGLLEDEDG